MMFAPLIALSHRSWNGPIFYGAKDQGFIVVFQIITLTSSSHSYYCLDRDFIRLIVPLLLVSGLRASHDRNDL